jgi:2'-5' RNA ligase
MLLQHIQNQSAKFYLKPAGSFINPSNNVTLWIKRKEKKDKL